MLRTQEDILTAMQQRGWRTTGPRRAIVEQVLAYSQPFSAEELYQALRRTQPSLGRATVFRTLDLLAELGVVERVHHPSGTHRYILTGAGHRHHVICVRCGAAAEFAVCTVDAVLQEVAEQTRFIILDHWLELTGLCQNCQTP